MSTLIDTSTLYDSLRALGPVMADEVPDSLASRLASADLDAGKVKEAIAVYAKLANEGTLQDFTSAMMRRPFASRPTTSARRPFGRLNSCIGCQPKSRNRRITPRVR